MGSIACARAGTGRSVDRPGLADGVSGVAASVVLRARRGGSGPRRHGAAEAVRAERYASGQITEDEYRRSRAVLKEDGS